MLLLPLKNSYISAGNFFSAKHIEDVIVKDLSNNSIAFYSSGNLNKSETPHKIKLCVEQWTPEADFVTAAFKLKRKNIQNFYQRDIKTLYGQ